MRFLTDQELTVLTGKVRPAARRRALDAMAIPYRTRPDGHPVVDKTVFNDNTENRPTHEPHWNAI